MKLFPTLTLWFLGETESQKGSVIVGPGGMNMSIGGSVTSKDKDGASDGEKSRDSSREPPAGKHILELNMV